MTTVFDTDTRNNLIGRINALSGNSQAQWGKMNVYQMLKHCTLWEEMILNNIAYKRVFIGRLLGRVLLKNALKDDRPMARNAPTIPELIITESKGDVQDQKKEWISRIEKYVNFVEPHPPFIHPFFGKMTREEIGRHAFKHADHHLRQFNG